MTRVICLLGALLLATSCSVGGDLEISSGTAQDRDVEEPLPEQAKQFSAILVVSNEIVRKLGDGDVVAVYDDYASDVLKEATTRRDLETLYRQVKEKAGEFRSFKPMQWGFLQHKGTDGSNVRSRKIVHHEKGAVEYVLVFADASSTKLIGLYFGEPK